MDENEKGESLKDEIKNDEVKHDEIKHDEVKNDEIKNNEVRKNGEELIKSIIKYLNIARERKAFNLLEGKDINVAIRTILSKNEKEIQRKLIYLITCLYEAFHRGVFSFEEAEIIYNIGEAFK